MEEAHGSQDPQKAESFPGDGRQKRDERGDISPCRGAQQKAAGALERQAHQEIGENYQPEDEIDDFDGKRVLEERGNDDEQDRQDIEGKQRVAEAMRGLRIAL